jgi:hypothetical protein
VLHTEESVKLYCCGDVSAGQDHMVEGFDCEGHLSYKDLTGSIEYGGSEEKSKWM